ncbi:hypothetical protein FQR65_LT10039 [Abscondita terminalis]|nr:hypothetical protein FQR65_LT10039 [Abscondita terminalis]
MFLPRNVLSPKGLGAKTLKRGFQKAAPKFPISRNIHLRYAIAFIKITGTLFTTLNKELLHHKSRLASLDPERKEERLTLQIRQAMESGLTTRNTIDPGNHERDFLVLYNKEQNQPSTTCNKILDLIPGMRTRLYKLEQDSSRPLIGTIQTTISLYDENTDETEDNNGFVVAMVLNAMGGSRRSRIYRCDPNNFWETYFSRAKTPEKQDDTELKTTVAERIKAANFAQREELVLAVALEYNLLEQKKTAVFTKSPYKNELMKILHSLQKTQPEK